MEKILLGYGAFEVDTVPIGLTRGGGVFEVEREYREITADGDKGPVKGRIVIDREVPKLSLKSLEAFDKDILKKFYPALVEDDGTLKSNLTIAETDYHAIKWVGKTLTDQSVTIELEKAINLENINFSLVDKDEVIPEINFNGVYDETARNVPTWKITFGTEDIGGTE